MIQHFETITNSRGDALTGYRVQVVTSAGAIVDIYADKSGTRFTDSAGNTVNYALAESTAGGKAGRATFYFTPATGQILQTLDASGSLVDAVADFADKYVIDNLPGELATAAVTGLDAALAAKTATADLASTDADKGAELVSYDAAQTTRGKLNKIYSVLDARFAGGAQPGNILFDSAPAFQAALDFIQLFGGQLEDPRGEFLFGSSVTIDRRYAAPDSEGYYNGERTMRFSGYGAKILTGGFPAFVVLGGWAPNHGCVIEGFTIDHGTNTTAPNAIRLIGAQLCTLRNIVVRVSDSLPADYAAFQLENLDPAVGDTGCFWNLIERCTVRPWSGSDGNCDYGVRLLGSANATTIKDNIFSGSLVHIQIANHTGYTSSANATLIDGNAFEAPAAAVSIELLSADPTYHVTGTRITNNRFESLATAVKFSGTGSLVQVPTFMAGNYADTSLTTYIDNPDGVPYTCLDGAHLGAPIPPAVFNNNRGVEFRNLDTDYDSVTGFASTLGKGFSLKRGSDDLLLGSWKYGSFAGGVGTLFGGTWSAAYRPFGLVGCQGIAARDTPANNLAGTVAFAAETSKAVSMPNGAEANASYLIFLDSPANETLWVSDKTAAGFTINAATAITGTVGWLLVKHV